MKKLDDLDCCMLDSTAQSTVLLLEAEGATMHLLARRLLEQFIYALGYGKCPCPACKRRRGVELLPDELEYEKSLEAEFADLVK
jgi:hypothetical protein